MNTTHILDLDLSLVKNQQNLPKNIYAIRVLNIDKNETFDIVIEHDGYCPPLSSERDYSLFDEYLSNLEYKLIDDYFKINKQKKPKNYHHLYELMTDNKGNIHSYSKCVDL
jgi:hypothetical protein